MNPAQGGGGVGAGGGPPPLMRPPWFGGPGAGGGQVFQQGPGAGAEAPGFPPGQLQGGWNNNNMNTFVPQAPENAPLCEPFPITVPGNPAQGDLYILGCLNLFRGYVCSAGGQASPQPTCRLPATRSAECPSADTLVTLPGMNVQARGCYGASETDLFCAPNVPCMTAQTDHAAENTEEQEEAAPKSTGHAPRHRRWHPALVLLLVLCLPLVPW